MGAAVKFTVPPWHMFVALVLIVTEGTTAGFTVIVIVLLVALAGDTQVTLLVMITFTCALFGRVELLNVELLVPAFTPFTCH